MKTYSAKPQDITRTWYLLDAAKTPVGRLSTVAARLLIGKDKPSFTSHIDVGDFVVVINAKSLIVTGNKLEDKKYYRHSGFPSGLTEKSLRQTMADDPSAVIRKAIRGMLPVNKLRPPRLNRLKIYEGAEHQNAGQKPIEYKFEKRGDN